MSKRANYFSIGIFVIIAFVLGAGSFTYFGAARFHRNTDDIIATFRGTTNGLRLGAKVKAYGVEIGQVKRIMLHRVVDSDEIVIPVLLEIDLDNVSTLLGYKNYNDFSASPRYQKLDLDAFATLQSESVLTGLLYVELVFGQGSDGFVLDSERFSDYQSIPTQPTEMELMLKSLQNVATNLGQTDFSGLVEDIKSTVNDLQFKINGLDIEGLQTSINDLLLNTQEIVDDPKLAEVITEMSGVMQNLNNITSIFEEHADDTFIQLQETLAQLEDSTLEAGNWLSPSSAVYREFVDSLDQIGDAARSLRILIQYLERNPNALLTGKPTGEPEQ